MKTFKNIILFLVILPLGMFIACGDDDSSGNADNDRFIGDWSISSVTLDNFDITDPEYSTFTIKFRADGSYLTTDGDPVFTDTGGFWSITASNGANFNLTMDGIDVEAIFNEDNNTVTLAFTANNTVIGARTHGLVGSYVFLLTKQ